VCTNKYLRQLEIARLDTFLKGSLKNWFQYKIIRPMVSESCCGQLHLLQKEIIIIRNGAKTISLQYFNIGRNLICIVCFSWLQDFFILQLLYPENHRLVASHCQTLSHNVLSITPRHEQGSNSQL
jgi:hypothetical protein